MLSTSSSARLDRWGSGGGRGGGGGGTGGAESRCCGAVHRQGCVRPLAAQVPAVQGVHGQFIDRVLDISVVLREGYPQCKLCRRLFLHRRPCDQQRQVPTVQRFESSCPDSAHPQSGEHSYCASDFRRDSTGAVLGFLGSC